MCTDLNFRYNERKYKLHICTELTFDIMNRIIKQFQCSFLLISAISMTYIVFYHKLLDHRYNLFRRRISRNQGSIDRNASCILPRLDPFHKLALQEMEDVEPLDCRKKNLASVVDGFLVLDAKDVTYAHYEYVLRPEHDDFGVKYSDPVLLTKYTESPVEVGKFGCLVANGNRILQFDQDDHVIKADQCVSDGFLEITEEGRIKNLDGKCLGIEDDCLRRCPLVLRYGCSAEETKFEFEQNGLIKHSKTGTCVEMTSDDFGDYTELLLSHVCDRNSSKWRMHHFPGMDIKVEIRMSTDFVKLLYIRNKKTFMEYHASAVPKDETATQIPTIEKEQQYNIILVILESQSASNVIRKMPETYKYLDNDRDTFMFHGHTIVGDGTTAQICAMLVGQLEEDLPETRRNVENSGFLDDWPFIFKNFSKSGYVTMYSEDSYDYASFNYRLNGFKNPPTDHYSRYFWLASKQRDDDWRCVGDRPHHQINLQYTLSLFSAYKKRPKLSVTLLSAISHNNFNNIQYVDADLVDFMKMMKKNDYLRNSFMLIVGDHGLRASSFRASIEGSLEEKLPFFSLTLPENFLKVFPHFEPIIKRNTQTLTSQFDIYGTLAHILNFPHEKRVKTGQSLLSLIDRRKRTCASAGIQPHWCPCVMESEQTTGSDVINQMAENVVEYINRVINSVEDARMKCVDLQLAEVLYAKKHAQSLNQTAFIVSSDVFIRISEMDFSPTTKLATTYEIVFKVKPSNGVYEANVYKNTDNEIHVDPNISRLDLYGNQPKCIMDDYPHLRKFCYCKEYVL